VKDDFYGLDLFALSMKIIEKNLELILNSEVLVVLENMFFFFFKVE